MADVDIYKQFGFQQIKYNVKSRLSPLRNGRLLSNDTLEIHEKQLLS